MSKTTTYIVIGIIVLLVVGFAIGAYFCSGWFKK